MERHENAIEMTNNNKTIGKGPILGTRHLQATLLFLNISVLYLNRVHVAISLVAMTNADKSNQDFPEYKWNEQQKSYILSSFYWGYCVTQFPAAFLTRRFGVKINLFLHTLATGLISLMLPFCISWGGWQSFCLLRFFQGISQGGVYPAFLQHLAKWSPPAEREILSGFAHTGFECGMISAMLLSGAIATSSLGWPGIFYIFAALCFIWCALWQVMGANDVNTSNFISDAEKLYIESSLRNSVDFEKNRLPVPWRAIFTSKPFYALLITRAAAEAGLVTIQAEWPSYLNGVLKLNIESNALFSALPPVASMLSAFMFMFIANLITKRSSLSLTATRKCFNSFGMWVPALGIIIIGYLDEEHTSLVIALMVIVMAAYNAILMGSVLNPIDLAPNHTNMVVSIVNTISNFAVLLGPLYFGVIVTNEQSRGQWQIAFSTMAVAFCIGDLSFLIFGTAKEQLWNAADYLKPKNEMQTSPRKS